MPAGRPNPPIGAPPASGTEDPPRPDPAEPAGGATVDEPAGGRPPGGRRRPGRSPLLIAAVAAALAVPPLVAAAVLWHPRWYPVFDMALIEMSVRDVASARPPLVGLVGRLGTPSVPGHHPGPLGFFALWPTYALAGRTAWALLLSQAVLSVLALTASVWIASRRGGAGLVLAVGAGLAVLVGTLPVVVPVFPWNPYEPALWWPVVLLGVWSVLDDDLVVLPLTVLAASLCAQTHVSYVGLVGGLAALVVVVLTARAVRRRSDAAELRRIAAWAAGSAVLGLVLWIPPLLQQLFGSHPNLSIIWRDFRHPTRPPYGWSIGREVLLIHLNPTRLLRGGVSNTFGSSWVPGAVLVATWAAAALTSIRLADRRIVRLHAVVAATLVLGFLSARNVHGLPYSYVFLWTWWPAVLMILASGWTAVAWWKVARPRSAVRVGRAGAVVGAVALLAFTVVTTARVADMDPVSTRDGQALGGAARPAIRALRDDRIPGTGRDGRYLVTWTDPMQDPNQGWALVNEMARAGLDVGLPAGQAQYFPGRRLRTPAGATAIVHLSMGPDIEAWRACPGAREIAYHDPRSPAEAAESRRLAARARSRLREVGAADLAPRVDDALFRLRSDPRVPLDVALDLQRIVEIDFPRAVFTGPPDIRCPSPPPPAAGPGDRAGG